MWKIGGSMKNVELLREKILYFLLFLLSNE